MHRRRRLEPQAFGISSRSMEPETFWGWLSPLHPWPCVAVDVVLSVPEAIASEYFPMSLDPTLTARLWRPVPNAMVLS